MIALRSRRSAVLGILLLVAVAAAVAVLALRLSGDRAAQGPTPLQQVLREIRDDGTWSKDTALRAFAAAFGPLPGVEVPDGPEPESEFAGLPLRMLARYVDEITPEQRAAAIEAAGSLAYALTGEPEPQARFITAALTESEYKTRVDQIVAQIEGYVGHAIGLPIEVIVESEQVGKFHAGTAGVYSVSPASGPLPYHLCRIHIYPLAQSETGKNLTAILGHEVWHCFENARLGTDERSAAAPPWIIEGQAMWAGEALAGGANVPDKTVRYWTEYLVDPGPGRGLFARSYDAIGFYSHLDDTGTNPWTVFDAMLDATSNATALEAALGNPQHGVDVVTTWGPSWFRDGNPTATFALLKAPGIPGVEVRPVAPAFTIAENESREVSAPTLAGAVAEVDVQAEVLSVDVQGQAVLGDMVFPRDVVIRDSFDAAAGVFVASETRSFCVIEVCACPDGSRPGPTERIGHQIRLAVTGDWTGPTTARLSGSSLEDWCQEEPPTDGTAGPCGAAGCASSNGDPHLTTVDLRGYDFQAAGEFTLLRADDGGFEVQARQEPYQDSRSVSINTAVAIGSGEERVAVYAAADGMTLKVNGEETLLTGPMAMGSLQVSPVAEGFEIAAPDGTVVWVLGLGEWGLNVVVAPSQELRAGGAGLLGPVGSGLLPRLPDGSSVDAADDYRRELYGELADAWAVSEATSLFDYEAGAGPATYRDRSMPEAGAPLGFEELDALLQEIGLETCTGIGDGALRVQCAFDVAVTEDTGFVDTYEVTDALLAAPAAEPSPGSITGGPTEAVLADVALIGGGGVDADGRLYLSVTFEDQHAEVVAIDAASARVEARVDAVSHGSVGFADGSLWVGEQEAGECRLRRLASDSLGEEARVIVDCLLGMFAPQFVAADDAVWVYDASGEDGPTLLRIDPQTNAPADSVALPFPDGFLQSSGSAVFYSDVAEGVYRLRPGETDFEPVGGDRHLFVFPAGDGFWDQDEDEIRFHDRAGEPSYTVTTDGTLVGASAGAALVERNTGAGPELWAYPRTGGDPRQVAAGPVIGTGAQEQALDYFGDVQPLAGPSGTAMVWLARSSQDLDETAVYVQWIPAP